MLSKNQVDIDLKDLAKKKRDKKIKLYLFLSLILILSLSLTFILSYFLFNRNNQNINPSLDQIYTLTTGYKFNYNKDWNLTSDKSSQGLVLTNKDNTTIYITEGFSYNNTNLNEVLNERISKLKNSNIDLNISDVIINGINFKLVTLHNKENTNIVKPDNLVTYMALDRGYLTVITIVSKYGVDNSQAQEIANTFRH